MDTGENLEKYSILIIPIEEDSDMIEIVGTWPI
jgi:hypothetical protein